MYFLRITSGNELSVSTKNRYQELDEVRIEGPYIPDYDCFADPPPIKTEKNELTLYL